MRKCICVRPYYGFTIGKNYLYIYESRKDGSIPRYYLKDNNGFSRSLSKTAFHVYFKIINPKKKIG